MSSLIRRLQIRALKQRGWRRLPFILVRDDLGGLHKQPVARAGLIANSRDQIIGRHWPTGAALREAFKPAEVAAAEDREPALAA